MRQHLWKKKATVGYTFASVLVLGTAIHTEHDQDGIQLGLAHMGMCVYHCLRWCSNQLRRASYRMVCSSVFNYKRGQARCVQTSLELVEYYTTVEQHVA